MSDQEGEKEKEKKKLSDAQEELALWIHGHIPTPCFTFFTKSPPFALEDLHDTLRRAIKLITYKLDPSLECMFSTAREVQHSIILLEDDFYDGRVLNVEELVHMETGLGSLSRERVIQLLDMCRDEIEWERNEIRRLEMHCDNAAAQRRFGLRETFHYRPVPRQERNVVPGVGVLDLDGRRDSAREKSCDSLCAEESSDEEMLEADPGYDGGGEEEPKVEKDERVDEAIACGEDIGSG